MCALFYIIFGPRAYYPNVSDSNDIGPVLGYLIRGGIYLGVHNLNLFDHHVKNFGRVNFMPFPVLTPLVCGTKNQMGYRADN